MPTKESNQRAPSHAVSESHDGKVVIHDLELFVGFDPTIDDGKDKRITKYDAEGIRHVVARTQQYMERGQNPKLILGHNKGDDGTREAIGDVVEVQFQDINGAPGIIGDVEMNRDLFLSVVATNSFPRRSAEIWQDGYMSEVALLGSETPARPLPDTKFVRPEPDAVEQFTREVSPATFQTEVAHSPGSGNVFIPSTGGGGKKKRKKTMDHDEKKKKEEMECEEEEKKKKAMKDDHKDKMVRDAEAERDDYKRLAEKTQSQFQGLQSQLLAERYGRKLDQLLTDGYQVTPDRRKAILERVAAAATPDIAESEFTFAKSMMEGSTLPLNVHIDQTGFRTGAGQNSPPTPENAQSARRTAVTRCTQEGKPDMYEKYYQEALDKVA